MNTLPSQFLHQPGPFAMPSPSQIFVSPNNTNSSPMDALLQSLVASLNPVLASYHNGCMDRLHRLETSIEGLIAMVKEDRRAHTALVIKAFEKYHRRQKNATKTLLNRVDRLEDVIGENSEEGRTLLDTLAKLEDVLGDMNAKMETHERTSSVVPEGSTKANATEPWQAGANERSTSPQPGVFGVAPEHSHSTDVSSGVNHVNNEIHRNGESTILVKPAVPCARESASPAGWPQDTPGVQPMSHGPSDSPAPAAAAPRAMGVDREANLEPFQHGTALPDESIAFTRQSAPGNIAAEMIAQAVQLAFPQTYSDYRVTPAVHPVQPIIEASLTVYRPDTGASSLMWPATAERDDGAKARWPALTSQHGDPLNTSFLSSSLNQEDTARSEAHHDADQSLRPRVDEEPHFTFDSIFPVCTPEMDRLTPSCSITRDTDYCASIDQGVNISREDADPLLKCGRLSSLSELSTDGEGTRGDTPAPATSLDSLRKRGPKRRATQQDADAEYPSKKHASTKQEAQETGPSPAASFGGWPDKCGSSEKQVQCDSCLHWYHFACAGLPDDDPRLNDDQEYHCPPCVAVLNDLPRLKVSMRSSNEYCQRPDCTFVTYRKEQYYAECFVGRKFVKDEQRNMQTRWLVKWHGYPISECTWQAEGDVSDPRCLEKQFNTAAKLEGLDLDVTYPVFLREVIESGWVETFKA